VASAFSKDVADAAHRVQKSRPVVHVESSAEPGDGDVDHIRHRVAVDPPDRCEEPIAVEHLILVPQEMLEDAELQRREVDRAIAAIEREEVLVARKRAFGSSRSSSRKMRSFSSRDSGTASMAMAASGASAGPLTVERRLEAECAFAASR